MTPSQLLWETDLINQIVKEGSGMTIKEYLELKDELKRIEESNSN